MENNKDMISDSFGEDELFFDEMDISNDNDLNVLVDNNFDIRDMNLFDLYRRDADRFPVLSNKVMDKYLNDLMLRDEILDVVVDSKVAKTYDISEMMLDLRKVFASVSSIEERDYLLGILNDYYCNSTKKSSNINKIISYYLFEYSKLCKIVEVPSIDDLNNYFKDGKQYKIFNSYSKMDVRDINVINMQVSKYVKYMIAREKIINHNQSLVIEYAYAAVRNVLDIVPIADLVQEGNIGLIKAVDKFDASLGFKFSTYATFWIKRYMSMLIANRSSILYYPDHIVFKMRKLKKVIGDYILKYDEFPTYEEIANLSGFELEQVSEYLKYINVESVVSLDVPVEGDDLFLFGVIEDTKAVDPLKISINSDRRERVKELLEKTLMDDPRALKIMLMRYGFESVDGEEMTFEEISGSFGITRQRIKQIEVKCLKKLRFPFKINNFKDFLD